MGLTPNDREQHGEIAKLLSLTDNVDDQYLHRATDEIYVYQPFLLSMFLGYKLDTSDAELDEILKIWLLIWEFFKEKRNIRTIKLTEQCFEQAQSKNVAFLRYLHEKGNDEVMEERVSNNLKELGSKSLFATILANFHTKPALVRMDMEKKGIILVGIKSLVEALEGITLR
jgi:hypothetical protein